MVFVLVACNPGTPGPAGPQGPPGIAADAALIAMLAARVNELEARQAAKVPHLVVAETGEDLGRMVTPSTVWRDDLDGELSVVGAASIVYAESDCKGDAWLAWDRSAPAWRMRVGPSGTVLRPMALAPSNVPAASARAIGDECSNFVNAPSMREASPFVDTGTTANVYRGDALTVAMR